ncbi:bifunctional adenosylcobinamide kinase/adenosylcobinamide-phosphate guanylyltransferase [uncultured Ramlibacter sp.]|uniref:bifunctional adenosylcobinamide kinase/adenosylcobinamide-phosphate guanylyltransferase n=1 Tax=uncultured Ramlibacter sp. TaxID=260755 RepID=UPI00262A7634|nr:bifunctional adenosylcobinamide kinase/adenosylcobinamide-phosphate guanylyltransferase [uncultured Ramlibacter sp.]
MDSLVIARSELILGGQKSGKTARAEKLAAAWLAQSDAHKAVYIATAQAWDAEMGERIARHRADRAQRVPRMQTVEEPHDLAGAIARHGAADTLLVVDCLTLWLTGLLMPVSEGNRPLAPGKWTSGAPIFIANCAGPLVVVSNEIGLGVIPMGRETRAFVDALGVLNQEVAAVCERVTFMAAGQPLILKGKA